MALVTLPLVLLLLATDFAASSVAYDSYDTLESLQPPLIQPSEYKTPACDRYDYPACPRNLDPLCGNDMNTYGNECILCMKIREDGNPIKIIKDGPC